MNDSTPRRLLLQGQYADGEDARHFSFRIELPWASDLATIPGQFFMLALPGYGEAPFTYVSPPDRSGRFTALIRRVGRLTDALFAKTDDSVLGYRGPFGKGWPLIFSAKRVLAVAGGCGLAPLAGLIQEAVSHCLPMQLSVIYGARHAGAQVLCRERAAWRQRLALIETLDEAPAGMRQGSPLQHFDELFAATPPEAVLCCGPEPLMLATAEACLQRGLSADTVWLSLERRTHCADGLCGHCYLGPSYVCRDGPTYRYDRFLQLQSQGCARLRVQEQDFC
jgi:anaerobic sulfite reductase subunit B